jgi:hypothetical protein
MGLLKIDLGQPRIVLDYVQRSVAQQALKREGVAATPQIEEGKSVLEAMSRSCRRGSPGSAKPPAGP